MLTIYGIKNCNTMKKAFEFLDAHAIAYHFFDYKKSVISQEDFERFVQIFDKDKVINKRGTTYRNLDDATKAIIESDELKAIYDIVKANQSILKRPVVVGQHHEQELALIGFDETLYQASLSENSHL